MPYFAITSRLWAFYRVLIRFGLFLIQAVIPYAGIHMYYLKEVFFQGPYHGQRADSIKRFHLTSIGNPIMEIRRSYDRLISTMGFPILVRRHLYIESGSRSSAEVISALYNADDLVFIDKCISRHRATMIQSYIHYVHEYRKISNIRRTKFQNLNDSHLVLKSSLPNPLKPGVQSRMKM